MYGNNLNILSLAYSMLFKQGQILSPPYPTILCLQYYYRFSSKSYPTELRRSVYLAKNSFSIFISLTPKRFDIMIMMQLAALRQNGEARWPHG